MTNNVFIAGDSYSEASELSANQSYISKLSTQFQKSNQGVQLSHIAKSGITCLDLCNAVRTYLDSSHPTLSPQLVIWQCGTNDCRYVHHDQHLRLKSTANKFVEQMKSFQSLFSAKSIYIAPPLLFSESRYASQFNPGLSILREYLLVNIIPNFCNIEIFDLNLLANQDKQFFIDDIHLNARAHDLIAKLLSERIQALIESSCK